VTRKIESPTVVPAEGTEPKSIEEYVGRVNTGDASVSIARMRSPEGWIEPPQTPEFDEYTLVLAGMLLVEHDGGRVEVRAGEAVHTKAGERVRYSTPEPGGAEYVAVCVPAFSPDTAHRDGRAFFQARYSAGMQTAHGR
jgi:mannose-6-phosphate isomerase-like protein (cupin superfamily)